MIAQSSGDAGDVVRAIRQVIDNCILTEDVDVGDFTSFDLEYFFVKLRARSVNNIVKLSYKDREDEQVYDVEVDLDQIQITEGTGISSIEIAADTVLKLRYPRISMLDDLEGVSDEVEFNFTVMTSCLDKLFYQDQVFDFNDYSTDDVLEFLDDLSTSAYEQIQAFIDTMPQLSHTVSYTNSNGKLVEIRLSTLTDFFMLG